MSSDRREVRFLVFAGSLRTQSLNDQLASLAAATRYGGVVDRATIADFEAPLYDNAAVQTGASDDHPHAPRVLGQEHHGLARK